MAKDPLESERNFRQVIERSGEARRQTRSQRGWLRFFNRPILLLLIVALCVGSFFIFFFGIVIKWTNVYSCSLAEARHNSSVIAELGEPIDAGLFAWGYWEKGTVTESSFRTTLTGPKGSGTLRVQVYASPLGSSLRMELDKDGRTQQVYRGPTSCH